uniref:Uncharacterized protein n=1 Tax=Brassica oleracea TaxID=3712 RepID=A0A3P6EBC9_BRAOL|nr:unnamed protein product [Brassica oleracea]
MCLRVTDMGCFFSILLLSLVIIKVSQAFTILMVIQSQLKGLTFHGITRLCHPPPDFTAILLLFPPTLLGISLP